MTIEQKFEPLKQGASLLIVLMGSVGDVVRGLCIPTAIKRERPDIKISWLVEPACEPLVRDYPSIDEVLVFERPRGVSGLLPLARTLSRRRFDAVIDLQRHFKSGFFSLMSGAKVRAGFAKGNSKEGNWLFSNRRLQETALETPKIEQYLGFLPLIGLTIPQKAAFDTSRYQASNEAMLNLSQLRKPYVALVLGSSWKSKDWTMEGYTGLCQKLTSEGFYVVLLGTQEDSVMAQEITGRVKNRMVIDAAGKTSLRDLFPILSEAKAAAGPDSGPAHISAAVGTPYVSLFGPTSAARTAPYGFENLVIEKKLDCRPCYRQECPGLGGLCMKVLKAEDVYEKLKPYIGK